MPRFFPIIFVHGWGGPADLIRDFGAADERLGGQALASVHKLITLSEGARTLTWEEQSMTVKLWV